VQGLDEGTWSERWLRKKQYQALSEDISIVSPDVDSTVFWFHRAGTTTYAGWPRPDVTKLLDEGRLEFDEKKRAAIYHKVVDAVLEDCPYIYYSHINYVFLFKEGLKGFKPTPQEYNVPLFNVDWA
jgi:ABC-type transport system substrate-binding protein